MSTEYRVLAAIDFSPCSAAALRRAADIAARHRAPLAVLHVVRPPAPATRGPLGGPSSGAELPSESQLVQAARRRWEEVSSTVEGLGDVTFAVEVGSPRDRILEAVRRDRPSLLVVGAHGRDDGYLGIGSVAAACAQRGAAEVLVVRQDQATPFRSIAACVDFNDTSLAALKAAAGLAAEQGATLHVVHVYTDPWGGLDSRDVHVNIPALRTQYGRLMEQRLRDFCAPVADILAPVPHTLHAQLATSHGAGINAFVEQHGCDLAVLGTRGHFNMRDFFWGSTAERVVREAKCSVLTVKPAGFIEAEPYNPFADTAGVHQTA